MKSKNSLLVFTLAAASGLAFSPELHAQIVWDRGASTDDLNTATNWSGDAVPASTSAAAAGRADATWDGSVAGALSLTYGAAFGGSYGVGLVMTANQTSSLNIANSTAGALTFRIVNSTASTNGGIQLASGAGALTIGAAGTNNPITLALGQGTAALNYYFANNSTNTATIEENVTIVKGGSHAASLIFSAGNWNVKGVVSDLGAGGLNVNAGAVTLSANNPFSAALNVNGGTLSFSAANNLGTNAGAIRLGQTTTSGTLEFTGSSNATISRLMRIGNGAAAAYTGTGTITNNGTGVLTFDNATFNEVATTFATGSNRVLTFSGNNTGNNTISGVIANNNPGLISVDKIGTGKWILSGNNTFSNGVTISDGTLVVGHDNALGSGTINLRADTSGENARLQSNGTDRTFANAVTFGGAAAAAANYLGGTGTGNLTFNGAVNWGSASKTYTIDGSTVAFGGAWTGASATEINTIAGTATATSIVILNGDRGTAAKQINIGNSVTVRANHANSFGSDNTEVLNILGGTRTSVVELTNDITLARTLTVQGRNTADVALRNLSGNNSLAISVDGGGTNYNIESTAGNLTISGVSGTADNQRNLFVTGAGNVTLANWNGRNDLTMNGSGTLTMGGPTVTVLSGTATVNSGTLFLNAVGGVGLSTISATGGLVINNTGTVVTALGGNSIGQTTAVAVNTGGLLDVRKNNVIGALSGGGTIRNTTATGYLLTANNDNGNSTFSGVMEESTTGKLSFTKAGTGTLTLSGSNTYTGSTTVSTGTLILANTGSLRFNIGATGVNNALNGAGSVTLNGGLLFNLASAGTITGNSWNIVNVGTLNEGYGGTFAVSSTLGPFSNSSGTWTRVENDVTYTFVQSTGVLSVTPGGADYSTWASAFSAPALSDTLSTADPDNDGLINAVEYALGLDPRYFSASPGVITNSGMTITYTKGAEAKANGDVTYGIETSTTLALGSWTLGTAPEVTQTADTISITFPVGPVKNFARLMVILAP
jgi:autotransporter-associated beta strand protein